jgi:hypothetical protein
VRTVLGILTALTIVNPALAATKTVCASGCTYTDLQTALDRAVYGDVLLLRAGQVYAGHFVLPAKSGTGWITIRSDAADSQLPPSGTRLVPSDRGGTTPRSLLPRLVGLGGAYKTTPVISSASGAHGYILQFLEIDGSAQLGYETLVQFGLANDTPPADIILDRVYIHGHPTKGQKRGVAINGVRLSILNSYITDIKAANADSQAILGYNGAGPFKIENNYLEAAGENILFGGADPAVSGLVPSDITIKRNHFFKPLSWKQPILAPPSSVSGSASSSGALSSGTHYFRVVAIMESSTAVVVSLPSPAVSVAVSSGQSATLSWHGVTGADRYRIYRGTSAGSQSVYLETTSSATSFRYTGTSELAGTPPSKATLWVVKNLFELKNAQRVLVEGNLLENIWPAGQAGYAIVLTPRNSGGNAPWVRVRDVTITNNVVRNVAGVVNVLGFDNTDPTLRTERLTFRNNLFYDVGKGGVGTKVFLFGKGPDTVILDRNTIIHENSSLIYAYSEPTTGFVYTNNIAQHQKYGFMGESVSYGLATINTYFPGGNVTCNVLAGGSASRYPVPNAFPSVTDWWASFVNPAAANYQLESGSVVADAGCGTLIPGVDFAALNAAMAGVGAPPPSEPAPSPTPNIPPVADPGGPYAAAVGSDVVADGSQSTDEDGSITKFHWTWGDEILVRAADLPPNVVVGSEWRRASVSDAAGGAVLHNPNRGASKRSVLTSPSSYVEFRVNVAAGVPYRLWIRMQAEADSYSNDSMTVQFSNAQTSTGTPVARIGTSDGLPLILEEGRGAGVSGWGWNDQNWGGSAGPIYFAQSGATTVRMQQREDGVMWDQFVLSSAQYLTKAPGLVRNDSVWIDADWGTASTEIARHAYAKAGTFPVTLTVTDNSGTQAFAGTLATIGGSSASLVADSGGPYSGTMGAAVVFDASGSSIPSGTTATYEWSFGDQTVLRASHFSITGGRWLMVSDSSAAGGTTLSNPNLNQGKPSATTIANPASYVEATFPAAAGVPYRVWVRLRADSDYYGNDSIYVQFSGSTTSTGSGAWRIGTSEALPIILEEGRDAGVAGWGWNDASYGSLAAPVYFDDDGVQRIRVQQREDGVRIDQIVITAGDYFDARPGALRGDTTILPLVSSDAVGSRPDHGYRSRGVYPVRLTIRAGGAAAQDSTTADIR